MPVAVRNLKTGPSVFSKLEGKDRIEIEWKGAGDPSGDDVKEVPDWLLDDIDFRRALTRGVLVQITSAEAAESIARQSTSVADREAAAASQAFASIDLAANNDMVSIPCQGPGGRDTGLCGQPVAVRESQKQDAPVLCPQHASLVNDFIEEPTGEIEDRGGMIFHKTRWVRPVLTAPDRSL